MTNCKKCKVICANCIHHLIDDDKLDVCLSDANEETNCITGKYEKQYAACIHKNPDGQCKEYEENKSIILKNKIIDLIEKYIENENTISCYCYSCGRYNDITTEYDVLSDVIRYLKGKKTYNILKKSEDKKKYLKGGFLGK